jgi:hypothetical protein
MKVVGENRMGKVLLHGGASYVLSEIGTHCSSMHARYCTGGNGKNRFSYIETKYVLSNRID